MREPFAPALDDGQADYATRAEADALDAAIEEAMRGTDPAYIGTIARAVRIGWDAAREGLC